MNIARPVQIMASENPFGFMSESGMAPCCLDPADVLATQGAAPIELLQNKPARQNGSNATSASLLQDGRRGRRYEVCLLKSRFLNLLFP